MNRWLRLLTIGIVAALSCVAMTNARPIIRRGFAGGNAGGNINLPYAVNDANGNQWTVFVNGMLQQRGNTPVYAQGAMLLVNGENIQNNQNRARQDDKTGEIIFDGGVAAGISVTRRVFVNTDASYVRYIDVLKNPQAQDQTIDLQLQSRVNFGIQNAQSLPDQRNKDRTMAYVAQTNGNRALVEIYSSKSAKNGFTVTPQQQDPSLVQANMSVVVPAGKEVAIMHLHSTAAGVDAGLQFAAGLKTTDILKGVSAETRRLIVNFNTGLSYIGDREILRGDLLDVIELRSGDQIKGSLQENEYTLNTFYGQVKLPADGVIGLLNIGQFRPRQLLITNDGQVFGGLLTKETIGLQLSSGQVTQVPLSQLSRVGYRKRAGETEDVSADKLPDRPMVLLRTGDRMAVVMPTEPVEFVTRYGVVKLRPEALAAVNFQSDDNSVHTAYLTDGSHFAGLVSQKQFVMNLSGSSTTQPSAGQPTTGPASAAGQSVTFPASVMLRMQLTGKVTDPDENTPTLQVNNGDLFVGSLTGQIKVDTMFDTLTINAGEIHTLTHARDGGADVQIELWDQSKLSGQLEDAELSCSLVSGDVVKVPIALVDTYTQPQPRPSANMVEQIKAVVTDLAADDWKKRDHAESQLVAMGPIVVSVLKQLSPTQPPEAQQRIESVLKQLADKKKPTGAVTPPTGND